MVSLRGCELLEGALSPGFLVAGLAKSVRSACGGGEQPQEVGGPVAWPAAASGAAQVNQGSM